MKQHNKLSRLILWQLAKDNWKAIAIGLPILALFAFLAINPTISTRQTSCIFVRWTVDHDLVGRVYSRVFCDLRDGRTILAKPFNGWMPPSKGTELKVLEQTLLFGASYRVVQ